MAITSEYRHSSPATERGVFDRVLCGVDAAPEGLEAVRQADSLQGDRGSLTVVTALDLSATVHAGWVMMSAASGLRADAEDALTLAQAAAPGATCRLVEGSAHKVLLSEANGIGATLIAVGTHGISRPVGIALGTVATTVLHEAPCSVLVARARPAGTERPRSVVVGVDGSPGSAVAVEVATALAERLGIETRLWAIREGKDFDQSAVDLIAENVRFEDGKPVEKLVGAVEASDLLIVGSRGLHGLRALGSVSERVAHKAPCSVLVVRPPTSS
jgi:nucleotide-binding universal stress UspA family protein